MTLVAAPAGATLQNPIGALQRIAGKRCRTDVARLTSTQRVGPQSSGTHSAWAVRRRMGSSLAAPREVQRAASCGTTCKQRRPSPWGLQALAVHAAGPSAPPSFAPCRSPSAPCCSPSEPRCSPSAPCCRPSAPSARGTNVRRLAQPPPVALSIYETNYVTTRHPTPRPSRLTWTCRGGVRGVLGALAVLVVQVGLVVVV